MLHADGQPQVVLPTSQVLLRGEHNLQNVAAACAIAAASGISLEAMREAIRGFRGVEHRLEWVRRVRGADWYNDSIATAPERALAALRSFQEPIVLLAGGRDKDLPWRRVGRSRHPARRPSDPVRGGGAQDRRGVGRVLGARAPA